MYRFHSRRRVAPVLVAFCALGFALPVSAGDALPFRGRADEVTTDILPVSETLLHLTITVKGEATHLGRFTGIETVLVDFSDLSITGTRFFVAANGDRLYADVDGAFTSATTAEGTLTSTGGTGRFRDASGEVHFSAVSPDLIQIAATFKGTIDY